MNDRLQIALDRIKACQSDRVDKPIEARDGWKRFEAGYKCKAYKETEFYLTGQMSFVLLDLDAALVGTPHYMGQALWGNTEYKFAIVDESPFIRRKMHHALLRAGLELNGESDAHKAIILRLTTWGNGKMLWSPKKKKKQATS